MGLNRPIPPGMGRSLGGGSGRILALQTTHPQSPPTSTITTSATESVISFPRKRVLRSRKESKKRALSPPVLFSRGIRGAADNNNKKDHITSFYTIKKKKSTYKVIRNLRNEDGSNRYSSSS